MTRPRAAFVIAVAVAVGSSAYAQEPAAAQPDATALAKRTQNPVGDLISIPLQFNFNTSGDLSDATLFNLNIQPVFGARQNRPRGAHEKWTTCIGVT